MVDSRTVSHHMNVTEWCLPRPQKVAKIGFQHTLIVRMIVLCWLNAVQVPIQHCKD